MVSFRSAAGPFISYWIWIGPSACGGCARTHTKFALPPGVDTTPSVGMIITASAHKQDELHVHNYVDSRPPAAMHECQ